jgi:hypothetical protein
MKVSHTYSWVCCPRYSALTTDSVVEHHSLKINMTPEMELQVICFYVSLTAYLEICV